MSSDLNPNEIKILITGFGVYTSPSLMTLYLNNHRQPFLDIKVNPSWSIVSSLPSSLTHKSLTIHLIIPSVPLEAAYHSIFDAVPKLLEEHDPDIVLHVGLAVERDYFAVEKGAEREGYDQFPDAKRKVWTKGENKKTWGKAPARLDSSLDLDFVLSSWRKEVEKAKGKGKGGQGKKVDVRLSDDVGSYVCGFVYYCSLEWMKKRGKEERVVFCHVPPLGREKDIEKGRQIVIALVKALAEEFGK
jgi:pyroglutamyl-peptidase